MSTADEPELREGVEAGHCETCGAHHFPPRFLCPRCGSRAIAKARLHRGIVEEVTTVRHTPGRGDGQDRHLAQIRAEHDVQLIAGLERPLTRGTNVELSQRARAAYAEPAP